MILHSGRCSIFLQYLHMYSVSWTCILKKEINSSHLPELHLCDPLDLGSTLGLWHLGTGTASIFLALKVSRRLWLWGTVFWGLKWCFPALSPDLLQLYDLTVLSCSLRIFLPAILTCPALQLSISTQILYHVGSTRAQTSLSSIFQTWHSAWQIVVMSWKKIFVHEINKCTSSRVIVWYRWCTLMARHQCASFFFFLVINFLPVIGKFHLQKQPSRTVL